MKNLKTIGLCGSLRSESWNLKLLRNFLHEMDAEGSFSTSIYPSLAMPLLNEDLERKPLDPAITAFRSALEAAEIVVIASPEYNGSLSAPLKNAIDWATRPPANLWAGKVVVLLSASPGSLGGARGLIHLRTVISGIRGWVIPEQVQLPFADTAFDAEGRLNETTTKQIRGAIAAVKDLAGKLIQK